ncbi:MAG: LuxR family transcriptional regulator [Nitratireductor sp.]|nr:LuxR family transcriptional regulator [Nitratireductor sp.]MCB1456499.1 LuxR family transcriptional regulator [Nitratireductor sp.]MCB1460098.1 LuxR family transcriptional regulator [Nitratireductor sp.]
MNSDVLAEFARLFDNVADQKEVLGALEIVRSHLGIAHATYNLAQTTGNLFDYPFVRTTYPADWMQTYLVRNYAQVDPVFLEGFKRTQPFFWEDLDATSPKVAEFFETAAGFGVSISGYSVPVIDRVGRRAFISYNSREAPDIWREKVGRLNPVLVALAERLHDKALQEMQVDQVKALLSPREIECLSWIARGKDASMISEILEISEFTVRDYLKAARLKLGCNSIAQAIYEASRLGLIKP